MTHFSKVVRGLCSMAVLSSCLLLQGCFFTNWMLKGKLGELQQEASGDIQTKRALAINEDSLKKMTSVDLVLNVPYKLVDRSYDAVIKAFNEDESLKKEQLQITDFSLQFSNQELIGLMKIKKQVGNYVISGTVHCAAAISTYSDVIYYNIYGRYLKIDSVEGGKFTFAISGLAKTINPVLNGIVPLINIVADKKVNQKPGLTAIQAFKFKPVWDQSKRDQLAKEKGIFIGPETKEINISISQMLFRIDQNQITLLGTLSPTKPGDVKPPAPLPLDSQLLVISKEESDARITKYLKEVDTLIDSALGENIDRNKFNGSASGFVTKTSLAKVVNSVTASGPITVTGTYPDYSDNKTLPVTIPIPVPDCNTHLKACKYKNTCSGNRCEEVVRIPPVLDTACRISCCAAAGGIGCAIRSVRRTCERVCTSAERFVTRNIAGPFCDGFRLAGSAVPGLCETAGVLDAVACTAINSMEATFCTAISQTKNYYDTHPIADIDAYIKAESIRFKGGINALELSTDLNKFTLSASLQASAILKYGLHYKRNFTPTDLILPTSLILSPCTFNWSGDYSTTANANLSKQIVFSLQPIEKRDHQGVKSVIKDGDLVLKFESEEWNDHLDFSPSPLGELYARTPHVALNCPLATVGGLVYGVGEKIFRPEEARVVWPLLTGENFPFKVTPKSLPLVIPAIEVSQSPGKDPIILVPEVKEKGILFQNI